MRNAVVTFTGNRDINTEIILTGSKSESNRALIIAELSNGLVKVNNLSNAEDTVILKNLLEEIGDVKDAETFINVDVGHAGTAMRFLTAYLSTLSHNFYLTGSGRMKQRPIKLLVDALRNLGANITYDDLEGYPPLKICRKLKQFTSEIKIKGNVSSQYLSALLMIAPALPLGLSIEIEGELTSRPYFDMTIKMLEEAGINLQWKDNVIKIEHQLFVERNFTIEPDWSACSYWYSIAALADKAKITLPYLKEVSLQGDSRIQEIMQMFGIETLRKGTGIEITSKLRTALKDDVLNLKDCPDLAQTIIVCAAAKGLNLRFTGLETLKIKETDRIKALQNELIKIGVRLTENDEVYTLDCNDLNFPDRVLFKTYDDHRMAMAFAPLGLIIKEVEIEDFQVVKKSYPDFWKDLQKAGFTVTEIN